MEKMESKPGQATISRRTAIGIGALSGLAVSVGGFRSVQSAPLSSTELHQLRQQILQSNPACNDGYWAMLFEHQNFQGERLLLRDHAEEDAMPGKPTLHINWDDTADSVIVGPKAVLRLFHKKNYQNAHITLLPNEAVRELGLIGMHDGASSYKLYRLEKLGAAEQPY